MNTPAIATDLTRKFDLFAPVMLAPMAGIAGGALAAAVSRAGGLGLIGGGYGNRDWLVKQFDIAGDAGVGVGFISWSLARNPDLLTMALERRPRALFLSFGDLRPFATTIKRAGVPLIAQVQTVEGARTAIGEGADIIVAQGTEAGGHGRARATMALVPAVADIAGATPVVAAGGIADGRGLAAALMLGATGVLCGTRFYAAAESLAHPAAKAAAIRASGDHTVKGRFFDSVRGHDWPEPWALRSLDNAFHRHWSADHGELERELPRLQAVHAEALQRGDFDTAVVIVGEAIDLVHRIALAADILSEIVSEALERLSKWSPR
jgi:nitronate monooxygenase